MLRLIANDSPSNTRNVPSMRPLLRVGLCLDMTASVTVAGKTSLAAAIPEIGALQAAAPASSTAKLDFVLLFSGGSFASDDLRNSVGEPTATCGTSCRSRA